MDLPELMTQQTPIQKNRTQNLRFFKYSDSRIDGTHKTTEMYHLSGFIPAFVCSEEENQNTKMAFSQKDMFEIEISCRCAILVCRSSWLCRRHEVGSLKTVIKTYKERMCHLRERCTHHADHTHHTSYTCPRTRIYIISVNSFMQPSSNFPKTFFWQCQRVPSQCVCVCKQKWRGP